MFETLAFSKGEIFILMVFAGYDRRYLCTQRKKPVEWPARD